MTAYLLGGDSSHWNIDYIRHHLRDLWDQGYRYLYIKVTDGDVWEDPEWQNIYRIAKRIGFKVGPYHYFHPTKNGIRQAAWFYNCAMDQTWDCPPALDVEEPNVIETVPSKPIYGARVKACLQEIEELFGKRPIVYTSAYKWNTYVDVYVPNDLWVAHYTTRPEPLLPRTWQSGRGWTFWQYTTTPIDTNRFRGDWNEFLGYIGEEEEEPTPQPPSDLEQRIEKLEADTKAIKEWITSYDQRGSQ